MCDKEKGSLKEWKPEDICGNPEEHVDIFPEEINIKIRKDGFVVISVGDICIGQIQELVLEASINAHIGNVAKFHIRQISVDTSENGEKYVVIPHEFDGVSEFISGQNDINTISEIEEEEEENDN